VLEFAVNWFDLIWIPAVFIFAGRRHWVTAIILVLISILALRLQVELMTEIGLPTGILPFVSMPALHRGYVIYGFFIFIFLLLSFFSKREHNFVYIAAAIGTFILSFAITMGAMFI